MAQAYYHDTLQKFIITDEEKIVGRLSINNTEYVKSWTIGIISWENSIQLFKNVFQNLVQQYPDATNWHLFLEYEIPRLSKRIDAVILADDIIFVIEFKLDRDKFELADERQVEDYALDLSHFHLKSRDRVIIPILFAPKAPYFQNNIKQEDKTLQVKRCLLTNTGHLSATILQAYKCFHNNSAPRLDARAWEKSEYRPTPTIIQAAQILFAGHEVSAISTFDAGAVNLSITTQYLIDVINNARNNNEKIVCFVTGVPGAGKTLVGLKIVHEKEAFHGDKFNTAYFSGNVPLINVLKEALARDDYDKKLKQFNNKILISKPRKKDSEREVKAKIQNLHSFIKDGIRIDTPPDERIVVFDEAQRCWDAKHFHSQSKRNQNRERNPFQLQEKSEAHLLFEFMDRHKGWAVIIALVGGGQEINTGEAGIAEWGKVLRESYSHWKIHISPHLLSGDTATAGQRLLDSIPDYLSITTNEQLHLTTSQRSFRASNLNKWVNAIIDNNSSLASNLAEQIQLTYPIKITRDLNRAKGWLRQRALGSERIGLIASSGGVRLRSLGIYVKESIDEANWFLNQEDDIRSSNYLEITATEFSVQGLELDFACLCWDADLRRANEEWDFKNFNGTTWNNITVKNKADRQYLLNKYRVLLTRARQGMIIFVPIGDINDETRLPEFYNQIFEYLKSCGISEV